jgi:Ankyrin repeats (many copies)
MKLKGALHKFQSLVRKVFVVKQSVIQQSVKQEPEELTEIATEPISEIDTSKVTVFNETIPVELVYECAKWLSLKDYIELRKVNKFFSALDPIPKLNFQAYKSSTLQYGSSFCIAHLVSLDLADLNDQSFLFLLRNCHNYEFARVLRSHRTRNVSVKAKAQALLSIVESNLPSDMALALVEDGRIDLDAKVCFSFDVAHLKDASLLQWTCFRGHLDLAKKIIEDKNADILHTCEIGWTAVHFAAHIGHTSIFKALLQRDPSVINQPDRNGLLPIQYNHLTQYCRVRRSYRTSQVPAKTPRS